VSFEAKLGQVTAIVGPAGAGKTTLVYHVPRFLRPTLGRVSVDGVDLAAVTRSSLRAQIAFVFQESALFDGTIEENLRLANPGASELELRRAVQISGADEFVRRLPDGSRRAWDARARGSRSGRSSLVDRARSLARRADLDPGRADLRARSRHRTASARELARGGA
jgi:ABC-type multidrug transport system fused ATPase/permease subunit